MNAKWIGEQPEKFIDPKDYKIELSEPLLHECLEDLHALADECREWAKLRREGAYLPDERETMAREFARIADKIDAIAKRLAEKPLHRDGQP